MYYHRDTLSLTIVIAQANCTGPHFYACAKLLGGRSYYVHLFRCPMPTSAYFLLCMNTDFGLIWGDNYFHQQMNYFILGETVPGTSKQDMIENLNRLQTSATMLQMTSQISIHIAYCIHRAGDSNLTMVLYKSFTYLLITHL